MVHEADRTCSEVDSAAPDVLPAAAGLPECIGRFAIRSLLGEGGMGVVFDAWDPELKRRVAIKLLRPSLRAGAEDSGAGVRLQREAEAMARLSHPNVVQIYETGQWDGAVFLAMEYIEGDDLRSWLERAPRTWRDVIAVFLQAGQGLAAAHAAGIVHRDFKPDNLLVGADGRVRVLDFGLARPHTVRTRLFESDDSLSISLTRADSLIGTPAYMSPEQHLRQPADTRSDQFSFCVTLWEALYGERPFPGGSIGELRRAVFRPLQPPPRTVRVPRRVQRILARGLQAAPELRYPELRDLLDALAVDPAALWWRVGMVVVGLVVAAVIAILARRPLEVGPRCPAAVVRLDGVWDGPRSAAAREAVHAANPEQAAETWPQVQAAIDAWTTAWVAAADEACDATRGQRVAPEELLHLRNQCLDDELRGLAALVDTLHTADAATAEYALEAVQKLAPPAQCLDEASLRARVKPPSDPRLAADVDAARQRLARADALLDLGRPREARKIADEVLYTAVAVDHPPLHAEALLSLGRAASDDFDYPAARDALASAFDAALASAHDEVATEAAIHASAVELHDARYPEALAWSGRAAGMIDRTGDRPRQRALALLHEAAILAHLRRKKDHEPIATAERALAVAEAHLPPHDILLARVMVGVAGVFVTRERPEEALPLYIRVRDEWGDVLGPDHPLLARTDFGIGALLQARDGDADGLLLMRSALEILERVEGPDHPDVASMVSHLGILAAAAGRPREAIAAAVRAESILAARMGRDHPAAARERKHQFDAYFDLGEDAEALAAARDVLTRSDARLEAGRRDALSRRTILRTHLAASLLKLRRVDAAEHESLLALADYRHVGSRVHIQILRNLAEVARRRGDLRRAGSLIDQAVRMTPPGHSDTITLFTERGEIDRALGHTAESALACERAAALDRYYARQGEVPSFQPYLCLGRALLLRGDDGPATLELERALALVTARETRASERGEVREALALALRRRDPARAAELTALARADYDAAGPAFAPDAARLTSRR